MHIKTHQTPSYEVYICVSRVCTFMCCLCTYKSSILVSQIVFETCFLKILWTNPDFRNHQRDVFKFSKTFALKNEMQYENNGWMLLFTKTISVKRFCKTTFENSNQIFKYPCSDSTKEHRKVPKTSYFRGDYTKYTH